MSAVLLVHVSADAALAARLSVDLRMSGVNVRIDEWEIEAGHSLENVLARGLLDGGFMALLLSHSSAASGWLNSDTQLALEQAAGARGIDTVVLAADDVPVPDRLQGFSRFNTGEAYEQGMDALLAKVAPEDDNSPNSRACAMIEHGYIRARRMEPALHRVHNLVINIAGGTLRRTDAGMVGTLYTVAPDRSIQAFCEETRLAYALVTTDTRYFSADAARPTKVTGVQKAQFAAGERLVDLVSGEETVTDVPLQLTSAVEAKVHLAGNYARGTFMRAVSLDPPLEPAFSLYGSFEFRIGL